MKNYKAPWSKLLIIVSTLVTALCVAAAIGLISCGRGLVKCLALLPLAIMFGAALFTVRGYQVTPGAILVRRLFWKTCLPLVDLVSAQYVPNAMRRSLRAFGNGGLFSITGSFNNKTLGAYRAYVTDLHRTVVLRFSSHTVVVSPSKPEEFVLDVCAMGHSDQ
ncbi:MAG TPA: hypothetical protein DCZ13_06560, partial [Porticoccaceae bacterium]|nr:hypothetical protein [Porticoccaceae bacterium]